MSPGKLDSEHESVPDEETDSHAGDDAEDDYEHLESLDDGVGCTEIWEHLSENRDD